MTEMALSSLALYILTLLLPFYSFFCKYSELETLHTHILNTVIENMVYLYTIINRLAFNIGLYFTQRDCSKI